MAVSSVVKDKVARHDLPGIRDALFMATMKDPGFVSGGPFDQTLEYCLNNGILESELFQADDGRSFSPEVSKDGHAKICASLRTNFSERKLALAREMGRSLYPTVREPSAMRPLDPARKDSPSKKVLAAILIVAAILLLFLTIRVNPRRGSVASGSPASSQVPKVNTIVPSNCHTNVELNVRMPAPVGSKMKQER